MKTGLADARLAAGIVLSCLLHAMAIAAWPLQRGADSRTLAGLSLPALVAPVTVTLAASGAAPEREAPQVLPDTPPPHAASDAATAAAAPGGMPIYIDPGRYYAAPDLTSGPRPLRSIAPYYADAAPGEGRVVAGIRLNERGAVEDIAILASSPAGVFDDVVRAALLGTPFHPGMLAGVPVKSRTTLEVRFDSGTAATRIQ